VTHREGPRSIRIRQREQRAARQTAAAQPTAAPPTAGTGIPGQARLASANVAASGPGRRGLGQSSRTRAHEPGCADSWVTGTGPNRSPELQALEAAVANSRQPGTDRRGLGSEPSRQPASAQGTRFIQALSASQPMEISAPPQPTEDVRDELMHWMDSHTALSIPQRDDALARYMLRGRISLSYHSHSTSMLLSRLSNRQRRSVSMLSRKHPRHAEVALLILSHPGFSLESPHAAQSQPP